MARKFLLSPDEIEIRPINFYRSEWKYIPDLSARNVIAVENQYLEFHERLLHNLKHQVVDGSRPPIQLGLSVRAGAIKTAVLICASIAEAALRSHAEKRGYQLKQDPKRRTFGNVLGAWQENDGSPRSEVKPVWGSLQDLYQKRNNVHLYKAVEDKEDFYDILSSEKRTLRRAKRALKRLKSLESA